MALRVMTGIVLAALLAFAMPVEAGARGAAAVRKQAVSSLRVSGNIVIGTDGGVRSHELDPEAPLTPVLVDFIASTEPARLLVRGGGRRSPRAARTSPNEGS